jgi:hypothetical protein
MIAHESDSVRAKAAAMRCDQNIIVFVGIQDQRMIRDIWFTGQDIETNTPDTPCT